MSRDRPRAIGRVRQNRMGETVCSIVDGSERYPGVGSLEHQRDARRMEPESQAVPHRLRRHVAARLNHLGNTIRWHDPSAEHCGPQGGDVRGSRVDAAVPASPDREVEDVGPHSHLREIPHRRATRELVRAKDLRVLHPRRYTRALLHKLVKRSTARAFRDQCEHHIAAVAVGEPFVRGELARVSGEHPQYCSVVASSCGGTVRTWSVTPWSASSST
jgi:hypothetical protein